MIDELGDRSQGEGVLDIDVVECHVLADHEGDGEVGGAPGGREESPLLRAQPLGLAEDGEICEAQIHGSGETSQTRRGRTVLANLKIDFHFSSLGSEADLFKDLRDGLVVGCDHRAVVVFEVLVNDGTTFSHRQPRTSLSH